MLYRSMLHYSGISPAIMYLNLFKFPLRASLVAQRVKNLPVMWEIMFWSLGWEDPLEKGMPIHHSSILAWRIPWTEEPGSESRI